MPYSSWVKPVTLPPGRARLATKPAPTGSLRLHSHISDTDWDIVARRVSPTGVLSLDIPLFDDVDRTVNSDLATLANGNFVAVFSSEHDGDITEHEVIFTIKTPTGANVVSPTLVAGTTNGSEIVPHVAALADGGFVVSWMDTFADQGDPGIRAAVFDASGGLVQGNILVNLFNQTGSQFHNDVTALPDGGFIVAWEDVDAGVDVAQRFDEAGNFVGTPFVWSNEATSDINAATLSDGRAILTTHAVITADDVVSSIWDSRVTDANQVTGANFFVPGPPTRDITGDLLLIRDINGVRQLEALQVENSIVTNAVVFGTVGTNQHFVG
jgi:hypothetical protein